MSEAETSAGLLEQVAAASLEPQLFAAALELECPVVALDAEDSGSDLVCLTTDLSLAL